MPVTIPAGGTALFTFDRRSHPGRSVTSTDLDSIRRDDTDLVARDLDGGNHTATLDDGAKVDITLPELPAPLELQGPWDVQADTVTPSGDVDLRLSKLTDWQQIPELQGRSGTATYRSTIPVPTDWTALDRGVLLDPGPFHGTLRAWINDDPVPVPLVSGEQLTDVTDLLRPGDNTVRFEITSTLLNSLITAGTGGDPNYAAYASLSPDLTGLTGPVRLIPFAETKIKAS
jgi:hypothetical protein